MPRNAFWYCTACHAENHVVDATCQYCSDCQGNCSTKRPYVEGQAGWSCDECGLFHPEQ